MSEYSESDEDGEIDLRVLAESSIGIITANGMNDAAEKVVAATV